MNIHLKVGEINVQLMRRSGKHDFVKGHEIAFTHISWDALMLHWSSDTMQIKYDESRTWQKLIFQPRVQFKIRIRVKLASSGVESKLSTMHFQRL